MFTNDDQTSYDTYNPAVIDLTQPIEQIDDNTVIDLRDNSGSKIVHNSNIFHVYNV